ncbi:MAG: hypothetical protein PHS84_09805 [Paludibacter sp.]|nr:hypothetical protein [Paludibacter sp.]
MSDGLFRDAALFCDIIDSLALLKRNLKVLSCNFSHEKPPLKEMKEEKEVTRKIRKKEKIPVEKRNFNNLYHPAGLSIKIKKPAFNQTFPSPHLTGKGRARLNAGEMFVALQ